MSGEMSVYSSNLSLRKNNAMENKLKKVKPEEISNNIYLSEQ